MKVFPFEFHENFQNSFFVIHIRVTTSRNKKSISSNKLPNLGKLINFYNRWNHQKNM